MTHDNHPTAAPLSREQITSCRKFACFEKNWVNKLCDMAQRSLARPGPSDMAEDVETVEKFMTSKTHPGDEEDIAWGRIVAHLSPRDAAPSGDRWSLKEVAVALQVCVAAYKRDDGSYGYSMDVVEAEKLLKDHCIAKKDHQQALDQARAEGLEMAAKYVETHTITKIGFELGYRLTIPSGGKIAKSGQPRHAYAAGIRAIIPAGQQTKGDVK